MLNFTENIQLKIRNQISWIYKELIKSEREKKENNTNMGENNKYLLLTNDNKYYIYITKFNDQSNRETALIYIFKDKNEECIIIPREIINWKESNEYLLEGYKFNNEMYFSDILYPKNNEDFLKRRDHMKKIIKTNDKMCYINEERGDILIGKVLNCIEMNDNIINETMKNMILRNFKYKNDINTGEVVYGNEIEKQKIIIKSLDFEPKEFLITKGNKIEIYNVVDIETKNVQGLLLIKTLEQSKFIKKMFQEQKEIKMKCFWDKQFEKWTFAL